MTEYSVADAENNLSELIDRALGGERVVITRGGVPVVELTPTMNVQIGAVTQADLDWLAEHRLQPKRPFAQGSGDLVSAMRDEDEH